MRNVPSDDRTLNITSKSDDARAKTLSPLWNRPFWFQGACYSSFEGFFNGIGLPEGSREREEAFHSTFGHAQRFGEQASDEWVWWNGKQIVLGSPEHLALIRDAHRASILTSNDRKEALLDTAGLVLTHDTPNANPHYTPARFCEDLTDLREELLRNEH